MSRAEKCITGDYDAGIRRHLLALGGDWAAAGVPARLPNAWSLRKCAPMPIIRDMSSERFRPVSIRPWRWRPPAE